MILGGKGAKSSLETEKFEENRWPDFLKVLKIAGQIEKVSGQSTFWGWEVWQLVEASKDDLDGNSIRLASFIYRSDHYFVMYLSVK